MTPHFSKQSAEVMAFMLTKEPEPTHSKQVARLAMDLFHGLTAGTEADAFLLHSAALLHDIGWTLCPDGRGHHKASAQLIREHAWQSINSDAVALIALLARYHRKSDPKPTHTGFQSLPPADQERVLRLSGILRVADALDRSHRQLIQHLRVIAHSNRIELHAITTEDLGLEKGAMEKKGGLFERVDGRPLTLNVERVNKKGLALRENSDTD